MSVQIGNLEQSHTSSTESGGITLTKGAVAHLRRQMSKADTEPLGVRIAVKKTGCSGLAYVVDLVHERREGDHVFTQSDGLDIYVDEKSLKVVNGTRVDYTLKGLSQALRFQNPNVTGECGCGESFTVG
jgi:iron-sulfur cluster assembly protein